MKVSVERQLSGGTYTVAFKVGDFSTEELQKMASFGVPAIKITWTPGSASNQVTTVVGLNQINERFKAGFKSEQEARDYETNVLEQIRAAMRYLRERKDDYSSSTEVAI